MNRIVAIVAAVVLAICLFVVWKWTRPKTLYLSDLKPGQEFVVVDYEWTEPTIDQSIEGNTLRIANHIYARGIGIHAPTTIDVVVRRGCKRFVAEVGVDGEVPSEGPSSVKFFVYGDGAVLYESPVMRVTDPPRRVDVWVDEIRELRLVCTDAGDGNIADHADWADAKFLR
jgi:hypothetical protein